jgi:RNA polymerase sigma-70 factor (ECF subfamily)
VDDATIVRGLHRGERAAWTALYDRYSVRIWRYAARLIGSDAAAIADVVQETFLAAAKSARQFDASRGTLWIWLAGIAHHQTVSHWRQTARHDRVSGIAAGNGSLSRWWTDGDGEPAAALESAETVDLVRLVLTRLPADYANLLTARYLDQLSIADMQPLFGGTSEALRSRLHRARGEFRMVFERLASGTAAREPSASPSARESFIDNTLSDPTPTLGCAVSPFQGGTAPPSMNDAHYLRLRNDF